MALAMPVGARGLSRVTLGARASQPVPHQSSADHQGHGQHGVYCVSRRARRGEVG